MPPNVPADGGLVGPMDKAGALKEGAPGPRASASAAEQQMNVMTNAKSATRFMRASYEQSCGNGACGIRGLKTARPMPAAKHAA
jgi:hypothetical protein